MSKDEMQGVQSRFLAISPLDGRYSEIGKALSPYFSEIIPGFLLSWRTEFWYFRFVRAPIDWNSLTKLSCREDNSSAFCLPASFICTSFSSISLNFCRCIRRYSSRFCSNSFLPASFSQSFV